MHERLQDIIKHPLSLPVAVGVGSFAVGVGLGYLLGKKQAPEIVPEKAMKDESELSTDANFVITTHDLSEVQATEDEERHLRLRSRAITRHSADSPRARPTA